MIDSINIHEYAYIKEFMQSRILVFDSIMGSGKSTFSFKYMKEHPEERYMFITPYLPELERIQKELPELHFKEPSEDLGCKSASFMFLLSAGENICATHELFKRIHLTERIKKLISSYGYILILDEVLEVIQAVDITKKDAEMLFNDKKIKADENGNVEWIDKEYTGRFKELMNQANNKTLIWYNNTLLLWVFPMDIIQEFQRVFLLTFLFDGSFLRYFLDWQGLKYELWHVGGNYGQYKAIQGEQDLRSKKQELRELIHIYEGNLNDIGKGEGALSHTWFLNESKKSRKRARALTVLFNNARNILMNLYKAKSDDVLWTCFSFIKDKKRYTIKDYSKGFIACNLRAMNKYKERTYLCYLINMYCNPNIKNYFRDKGIEIDENAFALGQLLQWIWRSAIRMNQPIWIYIPCARMRNLLTDWLTDTKANSEFTPMAG